MKNLYLLLVLTPCLAHGHQEEALIRRVDSATQLGKIYKFSVIGTTTVEESTQTTPRPETPKPETSTMATQTDSEPLWCKLKRKTTSSLISYFPVTYGFCIGDSRSMLVLRSGASDEEVLKSVAIYPSDLRSSRKNSMGQNLFALAKSKNRTQLADSLARIMFHKACKELSIPEHIYDPETAKKHNLKLLRKLKFLHQISN